MFEIILNRFPKEENRRDIWIKELRRKDLVLTEWTRICSLHFEEKCFNKSMTRVRFKDDALPTLFLEVPPDESISIIQNLNERNVDNGSEEIGDLCRSTFMANTVESMCSNNSCKRALEEANEKINSHRKKIKVLTQKTRRLKKKITSLSAIIDEMCKKSLIHEDIVEILKKTGPDELLLRQFKKIKNDSQPKKYSPKLRAFALTLHFYSPKAYNYVRRTFNSCLPHTRTINKWYEHINGEPGFTTEALNALSCKIQCSEYPLVFSLLIDEMAIRQHVEFNNGRMYGYVNMGIEIDDDQQPIAKEALVFMVTCINKNFKVPVGYFLIDGLSSFQRANLLRQCLTLLHSYNVNVVSLTFDGLAANFAMATNLGCNFKLTNMKTSFPHPVTKKQIVVFLDPSHMLKLVRNTFGEKKCLVSKDNYFINWKYIMHLNELQEIEGLRLGNRLRQSHINFSKNKMKVSLAAQLLSKSVSDAIEFCDKELQLPEFKGSEETIKFIRIFNTLFDVLNSRNLYQNGMKKALCQKFWEKL